MIAQQRGKIYFENPLYRAREARSGMGVETTPMSKERRPMKQAQDSIKAAMPPSTIMISILFAVKPLLR
ncbi:MAG: hypothetical protein ACM34I_01355 [bacterium]